MRALVTGGSGYFGSLLIKNLLKKGFNVDSLDINEPDILPDSVIFHKTDVRDMDSLKKSLVGYDIIFHNVAQVPIAKNNKLFWEVNVNGTKNICEASYLNNVKKIIYTSSSAIYGVPNKNPVNEETAPIPGEAYGRAKLQGEIICKEYSEKGLDISIIRPRTILGHGRLGIFSILFKWVSEGINIPVLNNGNNIYQFVHADDLANACILASKKSDVFSSYNIGAKDFGTMRSTLEHLCDYAGTGSKVYSLPLRPIEILMNISSKMKLTPLAPYHSLMYGRSLFFDINKAESELGYTPKYTTGEMFRESYDWFITNYQIINKNSKGSAHKSPLKESLLRVFRWIS
jgi:nucleoside-diphosphate-sugar epimerase